MAPWESKLKNWIESCLLLYLSLFVCSFYGVYIERTNKKGRENFVLQVIEFLFIFFSNESTCPVMTWLVYFVFYIEVFSFWLIIVREMDKLVPILLYLFQLSLPSIEISIFVSYLYHVSIFAIFFNLNIRKIIVTCVLRNNNFSLYFFKLEPKLTY
jgi:hypothetical protein